MRNLKRKQLGECFVDSVQRGKRSRSIKWSMIWVWFLLMAILITLLAIGWIVDLRVRYYQHLNKMAKIDSGLEGKASWDGMESCTNPKCQTANQEIFDEKQLTCAYWYADFDTILKVVNQDNGREVMCRVTDTGGFLKYGRIIDLSKRAFEELAPLSKGEINVKVYINNQLN